MPDNEQGSHFGTYEGNQNKFDYKEDQVNKVRKTKSKLKEGTHGIVAVDERTDADKFNECGEFFSDD